MFDLILTASIKKPACLSKPNNRPGITKAGPLALAAFITRPQAEFSNPAQLKFISIFTRCQAAINLAI